MKNTLTNYKNEEIEVNFLLKDKNSQDGTNIFWFEFDGDNYGVVEPVNPSESEMVFSTIVDCDGSPINTDYACNIWAKQLRCFVNNEIRNS